MKLLPSVNQTSLLLSSSSSWRSLHTACTWARISAQLCSRVARSWYNNRVAVLRSFGEVNCTEVSLEVALEHDWSTSLGAVSVSLPLSGALSPRTAVLVLLYQHFDQVSGCHNDAEDNWSHPPATRSSFFDKKKPHIFLMVWESGNHSLWKPLIGDWECQGWCWQQGLFELLKNLVHTLVHLNLCPSLVPSYRGQTFSAKPGIQSPGSCWAQELPYLSLVGWDRNWQHCLLHAIHQPSLTPFQPIAQVYHTCLAYLELLCWGLVTQSSQSLCSLDVGFLIWGL